MKDMSAGNCIVPLQEERSSALTVIKRWTGTRLSSSAAMIRRQWPSGFSRAALIGTLAFASCTLPRSSGLHTQMTPDRKNNAAMPVYKEIGEASWYGPGFHGEETASGETFDTNKMTAAHPSLPLGTKVKVTNLEKNKTVEVKINDRGPYADGRVIDLSRAAAKKLDIVKDGTAKVKIVTKSVKKKVSKKKTYKKKSAKKNYTSEQSGTTK